MKLGILADTHNEFTRTRAAVDLLRAEGAEQLVHCGDLFSAEIIELCAVLPLTFVFGNHDADAVPELRAAADRFNAFCLGWGGEFTVQQKRIAVVHGHLRSDLQPLLDSQPDYLLSGHLHLSRDWYDEGVRRINPGALHRADSFTVALLDVLSGSLRFLSLTE